MTQVLETPTLPPAEFRTTVARVRLYEGDGETMRLGFNSLAASYLAADVVREYLEAETGVTASEVFDTDDQEAPFVSRVFEFYPPLNEEKIQRLGAKLVDDTFKDDAASVTPEGIMLIDSRGKYAPTSPIDNGGSVHGELNAYDQPGGIIDQRDLRPQFAA